MSTDDRLNRLEQRLGVLEQLIRQLMAGEMGEAPRAVEREAPSPPPPPATAPPPPPLWPDSSVTEPLRSSAPMPSIRREPTVRTEFTEQWLGQRGLLAVGVLFVILAAGYLLKYSFDQGWVSPLLRCIGGALSGVAIGAVGWRLYHKELRTYGAALVGCGAAVIYLSVWAASRLYGFLPPPEGIAGLALISLALAAVAFVVNVEALGATAVLGAFLAPLLLGQKRSDADLLLLYLSVMAFTLGWVAARKQWRLTSAFIAISYFGLAFTTGAAEHADPWRVLLFGVLGGSFGLYVGLREGWWETRFVSFTGGWGLLSAASEHNVPPWAVVLAGVCLAVPVWQHALRTSLWPFGRRTSDSATPRSVGETLYFFATPLLLGWAVHLLDPPLFRREPGLVPLIIAVPYLVAGYVRVRPAFALVGTTAAGFAALAQWSGLEAVWALFALSLLWAALDHALARNDGRWYGLLALTAGLLHLVVADSRTRPHPGAAFVDGWALTLWAGIGCLVVMARGLLKGGDDKSDRQGRGVVPALWTMAGILLFWGVTHELPRFFGARGYAPETATLAADEAIVVWWLLFFGALLVLGVLRALRPVRAVAGAGLIGAALFLCYVDLAVRGDLDPAFFGLWAGALWLTIATLAGLAAWISPRASEFADEPLVPALWIGAGVLLLLGVTGELGRFFRHRSLAGDTAALWTGLSVSVWWICFACGLVLLGFRRDLRRVRQAGLLVAAMAAVKIILYDLSSLNALYRVGSVLITGLVSLLLAYLYNRKARDA